MHSCVVTSKCVGRPPVDPLLKVARATEPEPHWGRSHGHGSGEGERGAESQNHEGRRSLRRARHSKGASESSTSLRARRAYPVHGRKSITKDRAVSAASESAPRGVRNVCGHLGGERPARRPAPDAKHGASSAAFYLVFVLPSSGHRFAWAAPDQVVPFLNPP